MIDIVSKAKLMKDELKMLFYEIGIEECDIEIAEERANTHDYTLKAMKVLQMWRRSNTANATRPAIIQALTECKYIESKEILQEKWNIHGELNLIIIFYMYIFVLTTLLLFVLIFLSMK